MTVLLNAQPEHATKLSSLSPVGADADTYQRKLKRIVVPMKNVWALLNNKREWAACLDNVPLNARLVGARVERTPFALVLYLWHPDFLALPPGTEPPELPQRWERKG